MTIIDAPPPKTYTLAVSGVEAVSIGSLIAELGALSVLTPGEFHVHHTESTVFVHADGGLLDAEWGEVRAAVLAHDEPASALAEAKKARFQAIDARTGELIAGGFTFEGKTFSLSLAAQTSLIGLSTAKNNPLTWPQPWSTKDDSEVYVIADVATFESFYMAAFGTVKAHRTSGATLKGQVSAASDLAGVSAVVDTR